MFPDLFSRPALVAFDEPLVTSDGGALLLKAVDRKLGLTRRLADCLLDRREPAKVRHTMADLLGQRIFGICCGYGGTNDVARIGRDPMHKLLLGRDPLLGDDLASQPTLSRFENNCRRVDLYRLGDASPRRSSTITGIGSTATSAQLVRLDLDATEDPTHGHQQLALFNVVGHVSRRARSRPGLPSARASTGASSP